MKSFITLWKVQPLNPIGTPSRLYSPVQNCRKFSAVRGTESANSSNLIRPTSFKAKFNINCKVRLEIEKYIFQFVIFTVVPIVISKNTTGLVFAGGFSVIFIIFGYLSDELNIRLKIKILNILSAIYIH